MIFSRPMGSRLAYLLPCSGHHQCSLQCRQGDTVRPALNGQPAGVLAALHRHTSATACYQKMQPGQHCVGRPSPCTWLHLPLGNATPQDTAGPVPRWLLPTVQLRACWSQQRAGLQVPAAPTCSTSCQCASCSLPPASLLMRHSSSTAPRSLAMSSGAHLQAPATTQHQ